MHVCRYAYTITCTGFKKDASGKVVELTAEADLNAAGKKPPKGVLNWVAQPTPGQEPLKFEVRVGVGGGRLEFQVRIWVEPGSRQEATQGRALSTESRSPPSSLRCC